MVEIRLDLKYLESSPVGRGKVHMFYQDGKPVYASEEAKLYPQLDALLSGYFHQDSVIFGETLEEVLGVYRADVSAAERMGAVEDIHRFLQKYGPVEAAIAEALERTFKPETVIEGWEGSNAKQWLEKIAGLLA
jgi:hypothetical protein